MKLCATLFIFLFWINLNQVAWGGEQYGQPLSLNEITKISEIEKNPEAFVGRKVRLTGIVVEVCAKRGCWLDLASDTPYEKFQVKVTDGVIVFPMSARGRTAVVEGVVEALKLSAAEAQAYFRHRAEEKGQPFDPSTVKGAQTIYRLRATGAEIN
jgi:hypothetical protein